MPGWICPQCRRTVPEQSIVCPCGEPRETPGLREPAAAGDAAGAPAETPRPRPERSRASAAEIASVAALVAVYLGAVWRLGPPQPGTAPQPVPPGEATAPRPPSPPPRAPPSFASPSWLDRVSPPSTAPAPWAGAESYDSPGGGTGGDDAPLGPAVGERRLDDSLLRLSAGAGWLAESVPRFRGSCLDARTDTARCDAYRGEIVRVYREIEHALGDVCAAARRDGVLPETIRDLRSRHHVDEREWDDLAASVERLMADSANPL
jgi:hypothetical protein